MLRERCRRLRDSLLEQARFTLETAQALEDMRNKLRRVEELLTRRGRGGLMVSLGLALVALPEPVFSNIAGGMLVILGRVLQRRSSNIKDLVGALTEATQLLTR